MAQSLISKISALTSGMLHSMVDDVIKENSVPVYEEYLRRLEREKNDLLLQSNTAFGRAKQTEGQVRALEHEIEVDKQHAKQLLTNLITTDDDIGRKILLGVPAKERRLAECRAAADEAKQASDSIKAAVQQVIAQHVDMFQRLQSLKAKVASTKTKNQTAETLEHAASLLGGGNMPSVDDMSARIDQESFAADARLQQATSGIPTADNTQAALDAMRADELMKELMGGTTQPQQ